MGYDAKKFETDLNEVLKEIRTVLLEKNESYGDACLDPVNVFTDLPPDKQIQVRMNDKINRLIKGKKFGNEDTKFDLMGYIIIERIYAKRNQKPTVQS